ncbi:Cloroperoxidase [Chaetomidium leptoderma]|uniref:Cloroperoxidase n=1 Tax=Chaetomidium leptoderma TaxID=669021 RepID=A0AAN6VC89_9PEZI|nr:Cloroperoxidase [Chaetomidium leptoderma]
MKLSVFANLGLLGLAASARGRDPEGHEYRRQPGSSRSPCPGLNAMANHGFLPRSGENIDLATLRAAVGDAYHYEPAAADGPFNEAMSFNLTTTGNSSTFNLADLAKHDAIEFDGSLSRNDFFLGDNLHFDPAIWGTVAKRLNLYKTGPAEKDKYVTVEAAAKARAARVKDAMRANRDFNASASQIQGSPGTTALYLTTLWDPKADAAPKAWIKAFFEEERIPYREGYSPQSEPQKTLFDIGALFQRVQAVKIDAC